MGFPYVPLKETTRWTVWVMSHRTRNPSGPATLASSPPTPPVPVPLAIGARDGDEKWNDPEMEHPWVGVLCSGIPKTS